MVGPVIEKSRPGAFITEHPRTLLENGKCQKIPMMQGYCNREGLLISVIEHFQAAGDPPVGVPIEVRIARVAKLDVNDDFVVEWGRRIRKLYLERGDPDGEVLVSSKCYVHLMYRVIHEKVRLDYNIISTS